MTGLVKPMDCDTILAMDDAKLMKALDAVQPGWDVKYADRAKLEQTYWDRMNGIRRQTDAMRTNALRNMKDCLWLLGHSALCVKEPT